MDLKDATLMILNESAAHPSVAKIAQAAYDQLASGQEVDHRVLDDLVGEASGKGVLRAIRQKYGATAHEAIFAPILREIDREKPVPPRRRPAAYQDSAAPVASRRLPGSAAHNIALPLETGADTAEATIASPRQHSGPGSGHALSRLMAGWRRGLAALRGPCRAPGEGLLVQRDRITSGPELR
jgi:hypothetical protein